MWVSTENVRWRANYLPITKSENSVSLRRKSMSAGKRAAPSGGINDRKTVAGDQTCRFWSIIESHCLSPGSLGNESPMQGNVSYGLLWYRFIRPLSLNVWRHTLHWFLLIQVERLKGDWSYCMLWQDIPASYLAYLTHSFHIHSSRESLAFRVGKKSGSSSQLFLNITGNS